MEASRKKFGIVLMRMAIGAVAGFAAMKFGLENGLGPLLKEAGPGSAALAGSGLIYGLMGLFVGIGVAAPGLGSKLLNVTGREDIEDQRAQMTGGAVGCLALGIGMVLLALAGPDGAVPGVVGVAAFGFALFLTAVITLLQWRGYDELWRNMSMESAAWGGTLIAMTLLVWGALALIGRAILPDPAGLVALVMGLNLLGTFIAVGRRGLLIEA